MMILGLLMLLDIAATKPFAPPVPARTPAIVPSEAAPFWQLDGDQLIHKPSGMRIPLRIEGQSFGKIGISSHHGTGLDDALEWQDAGRRNYTTLFVFRPALADTGLAAAMAGVVINAVCGNAAHPYDDRVVAVGSVEGAARRILYDGAVIKGRSGWTGTAIFKIGAWMVVARMSGDLARKAELEHALDALLADLRFAHETPPARYHTVTLTDCPAPTGADAQAVVPESADAMAEMLVMSAMDSVRTGSNEPKMDQRPQVSRVPDALCRQTLDSGRGKVVELWPVARRAGLADPVRLMILNDAGSMLEVAESIQGKPPFYIIHHDIGGSNILGTLDAPPSQAQLAAMIAGTSPLLHSPTIGYRVDANGHVTILVPPVTAEPGK